MLFLLFLNIYKRYKFNLAELSEHKIRLQTQQLQSLTIFRDTVYNCVYVAFPSSPLGEGDVYPVPTTFVTNRALKHHRCMKTLFETERAKHTNSFLKGVQLSKEGFQTQNFASKTFLVCGKMSIVTAEIY